MIKFEYFEPGDLREAVSILSRYRNKACILAGGTDLIVRMKRKEWKPKVIINIKRIRELNSIKSKNGRVIIGANVTQNEVIQSKVIRRHFPILVDATKMMASNEIRNIATVVGNLCNASPAADLATPLLCLESVLIAMSERGEREVKITNFFKAPGKTSLKPDELVTHIILDKNFAHNQYVFLKQGLRNALDIAIVNTAMMKSDKIRIALGAVAPTPIRAYKTENFINKKKLDEKIISKAANIAVSDCKPIDDIRASAWYRREIVQYFIRTALENLL